MATFDSLTEEQWGEAYRYLLQQLSRHGFAELVVEVEDAASSRIVEGPFSPQKKERAASEQRGQRGFILETRSGKLARQGSEEGQLSAFDPDTEVSKPVRAGAQAELGEYRVRAPKPKEAFVSAVSVLRTLLREVPALGQRLSTLLERAPEEIRWLPDTAEDEIAAAGARFNCGDLMLTETDQVEVEKALQELENLMGLTKPDNDA